MQTPSQGAERRGLSCLPLILVTLLLLAGAGFALYKLYVLNTASSRDHPDIQKQLETNARLLEEKNALEALLTQEPCAVRQHLQEKGAITPLTLPAQTQDKLTDKATASVPDKTPDKTPADAAQTIDRLEDATVFVLGLGEKQLSMGSGFFIAPDLILTNKHVIASSPNDLFVINKKLRHALPAKLVAVSDTVQRDYAVLRVQLPANLHITPLELGENPRRAARISAWGYPHAISKNDPKYQALIAGKGENAPELSYADGVVSAVLERKPPLIVHTAPLSPGNSGGPLANEQGQVVGINTMISLDEDSYRQTSISLPASDIRAFLREKGIQTPAAK